MIAEPARLLKCTKFDRRAALLVNLARGMHQGRTSTGRWRL